ncbi:hypothetical protein M0R45_019793 [Rubus argutus]|uniref:Reverse transcriptase domain-containing protein n=1 Tax=Rubus argutus TaxID=59490 RepID=A0AAW1X830_RUBAR
MDNNLLLDIGFTGQKFTWENRRADDSHLIKERLDRAIVNSNWIKTWPNSQISHETRVGSDHCPILLNIAPKPIRTARQFRFEAMWVSDPDCFDVVQRSWSAGGSHNPYLLLSQKLGSCRRNLINWSKEKFPNNVKLIEGLNRELAVLQETQMNVVDRGREAEIIGAIGRLWTNEELYWKQRSRVNWLQGGDRNTKFFHLTTLQRRQQNRILKIANEDGNWITGDVQVRSEVDEHFKRLFETSGIRDWGSTLDCVAPVISHDQNVLLTHPFSLEEIKSATQQLGNLNAPGPDGFPGYFYNNYWSIVHGTINSAAESFYRGEFPLNFLNRTNVSLIPKVPNPDRINQFRPISLCNNSYKIFSKVLANRLKSILPNLISEQQNAFVPGGLIQDNLIIAHEAFHYLRLKCSKREVEMGIKIDMNKAYDRVEWDFLEATLHKMGFCQKWISLIMGCVKTVSFSIGINGKQGDFFQPTRGLRQGDPLSPYLFLLVSEVLSLNIAKLLQMEDFMADTRNCLVLNSILKEYSASGQSINYEKSSLVFSTNTPTDLKESIGAVFNIPLDNCTGNYLGLPTHWGRSKRDALAYVRDRVNGKLDGWKSLFLSPAGKEVLIKSVATAVPSYPMSCFLMPVTLCREINADIARFWWRKEENRNGIHWMSWDRLCRPKEAGGLGFRDLESYNKAMLAKQCWRIINNPSALWARIIKARYFPNCSFMEASKGSRASWGWSSLLTGRDTIDINARWQIHNGRKVDVWRDRWIPNSKGGLIEPTITNNRFTPLQVSELINEDSMSWNIDHITPFITDKDAIAITAIPLNNHLEEDRLSPKSLTMWRALNNSLPTFANLWKRKVSSDPMCKLCQEDAESVEHCLLLCPWVESVWFGCALGLFINKGIISTFDQWFENCLEKAKFPIGQWDGASTYISFLLWEIWKTRCTAVYEGLTPSPKHTIARVNLLVSEFLDAHKCPSNTLFNSGNPTPTPHVWTPPTATVAKINVDGAWDASTFKAGIGVVIRNNHGSLLWGSSTFGSFNSSVETEAAALVKGLTEAANLRIRNIHVESDNLEVINALNMKIERGNWRIYPFLREFHRLKHEFHQVSWSWISREANRAADAAAKLAKVRLCTVNWTNCPPTSIVLILQNDGLPDPP